MFSWIEKVCKEFDVDRWVSFEDPRSTYTVNVSANLYKAKIRVFPFMIFVNIKTADGDKNLLYYRHSKNKDTMLIRSFDHAPSGWLVALNWITSIVFNMMVYFLFLVAWVFYYVCFPTVCVLLIKRYSNLKHLVSEEFDEIYFTVRWATIITSIICYYTLC